MNQISEEDQGKKVMRNSNYKGRNYQHMKNGKPVSDGGKPREM